MSLLRWQAVRPKAVEIGEERIVRRFVVCKRLGDEWRALGFERIVQQRSYHGGGWDEPYLYWESVRWAP